MSKRITDSTSFLPSVEFIRRSLRSLGVVVEMVRINRFRGGRKGHELRAIARAHPAETAPLTAVVGAVSELYWERLKS